MLKGYKKKQLFEELILPNLPKDLQNYIYIEPFGGTFAVASYLTTRPKELIYSDAVKYDFQLATTPDKILHEDFEKILKKYDQQNVFFYLDPPYYGKEDLYDQDDNIHQRLHDAICTLKYADFLISYEKHSKILQLYKNFKIISYDGQRLNFLKEIIIKKG